MNAIATVHAAVAAGISLLDLAPRYGDGKAELVVGKASAADCRRRPGDQQMQPPQRGARPRRSMLRQSIEGSLQRLRLSRLDLFSLHSNVVPDESSSRRPPDAASRMTLYPVFVGHVVRSSSASSPRV